MIINNNHVQGIFVFNPDSTIIYEKDDFVVHKQNIYICEPKHGSTVSYSGSPNEEDDILKFFSDNFTVYLGGERASWEDFKNRYNNLSNIDSDPIITCSSIVEILKKIVFGIDSDGIIDGYVDLSGSSDDLVDLLNLSDNSNINILDQIILLDLPEFNNILLKVDRNLLNPYLPTLENNENNSYVILKQYTYREGNNYIRVQEIIDHINGVCLYRYSSRSVLVVSNNKISTSDLNGISSWKLSCANTEYLSRINNLLLNIYKTMNTNESSNNGFYFKKLTLLDEYVIEGQHDLSDVTIVILTKSSSDSYWKSNSITVNLEDKDPETETYTTYEFQNGITVTKGSSENPENPSKLVFGNINSISLKVQSIYIKNS